MVDKSDLLAVTPAPLAKQKVNPQSQPLAYRQLVIQVLRLQADRRFTTRTELDQPLIDHLRDIFEPIHRLCRLETQRATSHGICLKCDMS